MKPLIGISADVREGRHALKSSYAVAVAEAGGLPVIVPPMAELVEHWIERLDGLILSGGDDPVMEPFGQPTHEKACRVSLARQGAELRWLHEVSTRPAFPVLGVCLGMQYMGLVADGTLCQHLDDVLVDPEVHRGDRIHRVEGMIGVGQVASWHHQALSSAGRLRVIGRAPDGVIEAVDDPNRKFYVGVQWHPERTADPVLGVALIGRLVDAARTTR